MARYLYLCVGGEVPFDRRDEANRQWTEYMSRLGKTGRVTDAGPLGVGKTVLADDDVMDFHYGLDSSEVAGYWIASASDLDEAVELVEGCPQFLYGGTVEVREVVPITT